MSAPPGSAIVELENVTRRYGKVLAVRDFDLTLHAGEVVGLVGDNGAGKSTVVKMISGYVGPTSGTLRLMGEPVRFKSPKEARAAGIETVYQDLAIVDDMALWRNFFLGKEIYRRVCGIRVLQVREMARICGRYLDDIGLTSVVSPFQTATSLSGGERQSLAISRAVYFESRVLLLDEPVAALSVRETRRVFDAIEDAKRQGMAVLYIDHNMDHVTPVADRIAIMHRGGLSRIVGRDELTTAELAEEVAASGLTRGREE